MRALSVYHKAKSYSTYHVSNWKLRVTWH